MGNIIDNLIGPEGAKFDVTVRLGKQTQMELFGIVLGAIVVGIALNFAFNKLIGK